LSERPRVLHAPLNIAGGPGAISKGLQALGCESTMLVFNEQPFERGFDVNLRLRKGGRTDLPLNLARQFRALAWTLPRYDVFHFHGGHTLVPDRLNGPILRAARKGVVFQSWGSDLRNRTPREVGYLRGADAVIVGSFLTRRLAPEGPWPSYEVVPPAIVLDEWEPAGKEPGTTLRIVHAPSKRAVKGTEAVIVAVEGLRSRGAPVELDLVEGVPHREARKRFADADVIVDQLRIGWYGMFAIESMALGKPVVCFLDEDAAAETDAAFGLELPIIRSSEQELPNVLERLVETRNRLPELGRRSREYAERIHGHVHVARRVLEVYARAGLATPDAA
jgi:glycosyltransferase involved in cell wall biosynthesis